MGNFQTRIEITSILVFIEPRQPTLAPGNQLYFTFVKNPRHASKAIVASIQFNLGEYAQTFYNLLTLLKSFNVMFPRDSLTQSFCDGFISRKKISHKMFEQPECARVWFNVSRARPSYKLHHLIESTFRVHHPPFVSYPSPF